MLRVNATRKTERAALVAKSDLTLSDASRPDAREKELVTKADRKWV